MTTESGEEIKISNKKIKSIGSDPAKTAKAISLVYVNDTEAGITRIKKGEKFEYFLNDKKVQDDEDLPARAARRVDWPRFKGCRDSRGQSIGHHLGASQHSAVRTDVSQNG